MTISRKTLLCLFLCSHFFATKFWSHLDPGLNISLAFPSQVHVATKIQRTCSPQRDARPWNAHRCPWVEETRDKVPRRNQRDVPRDVRIHSRVLNRYWPEIHVIYDRVVCRVHVCVHVNAETGRHACSIELAKWCKSWCALSTGAGWGFAMQLEERVHSGSTDKTHALTLQWSQRFS